LGNTSGCAGIILLIAATLTLGFYSYFSASIPPSTPLDEASHPFVLADEGVNYSFSETFNCQFEIGGNVEFLDKNIIDRENIVIKLQPLATYDDRPAATAYIGSDTAYGLIVVGNYWYLVWVHDLTLDTPLSEGILVDNLDCASGRTRAQVNFRQIIPFR
jgi:hypothetical protein